MREHEEPTLYVSGQEKITEHHLARLAYIYIRQSSPGQVANNKESALNQRLMAKRAVALGWRPDQVHIIKVDQGVSGKYSDPRAGFQELVAEVSLGHVGIILGYEVSRLARNNSDWYRLMELADALDTLIGDYDGIYEPGVYNDRLLLGLKGTISEAELHLLRLRMDAGRVRQIERGEYRQALPTGLVRLPDGTVVKDPDDQVRHAIALVFAKFEELRSARQVTCYFRSHDIRLPRRHIAGIHAGELLWKPTEPHMVYAILRNPAYAGAFAYGRTQVDQSRRHSSHGLHGERARKPMEEWIHLEPGVYPAYITWEQYMTNQGNYSGRRERDKGTTNQSIMNGTNDVMTLFARSRDVAADGTEKISAGFGAKRAGDFLLDLNHAHVAFGEVVVERNTKVRHERERFDLVPLEAIQQVLGRRLFLASAFGFGRWIRRRVRLEALMQQVVVAFFIMQKTVRRQAGPVQRRRFDFGLDVQQQLAHVLRPGLLVLVKDELQLAQMMRIAKGVLAIFKLQVGGQVVMHRTPAKFRQDADGAHSFLTAFAMNGIMRQGFGACHMHPVQFAFHAQPTFVEMRDASLNKMLFDACQREHRLCNQGFVCIQNERFAGPMLVEIFKEFADARQGQQLVVVQVHRLGFQARPVLHCLRHIFGKVAFDPSPTLRTQLDLSLMLNHGHTHRRNVKHLSPFYPLHLDFSQIRPALRAALHFVALNMIWLFDLLERVPFVSWLTTASVLASLAQAARARLFPQAVAAWRLAAVLTVFRQLVTQFLDQYRLLRHLSLQFDDDRKQCRFVQFRQLFRRQVVWVRHDSENYTSDPVPGGIFPIASYPCMACAVEPE
jgi:DNA invertase Pin-like site-specific DNA recombinase